MFFKIKEKLQNLQVVISNSASYAYYGCLMGICLSMGGDGSAIYISSLDIALNTLMKDLEGYNEFHSYHPNLVLKILKEIHQIESYLNTEMNVSFPEIGFVIGALMGAAIGMKKVIQENKVKQNTEIGLHNQAFFSSNHIKNSAPHRFEKFIVASQQQTSPLEAIDDFEIVHNNEKEYKQFLGTRN